MLYLLFLFLQKSNQTCFYLYDGKDEFLSYFPRFAEGFAEVEEQLADIEWYAELLRDNTSYLWDYTRKDFAASIDVQKEFKSFIFYCYQDHNLTWKKYTENWDVFKWKKFMEKVMPNESN